MSGEKSPVDPPLLSSAPSLCQISRQFQEPRRIRAPSRTCTPPGWYLPGVSQRRAELDSFDIIEGFIPEGGVRLEAPTSVVSLHGGLPGSSPRTLVTARIAVEAFAPLQESGFQAAIENLNGRWYAKVWLRVHHDSLVELQQASARYVAACSPASCRPRRSGSSATPLSRSLASGSPGSSSRSGNLHPPHLRAWSGRPARPRL